MIRDVAAKSVCSSSSEEEEEIEVAEIDSDSDSEHVSISKMKKSTKNKKKPIICRDISSFIAGYKRIGTEINGIVDVSKVAKKKKYIYLFNKTRSKLRVMKHVILFPYRLNNNTSFPSDASERCINLHYFTERPWIELYPSTFKVKCWIYSS